LTTEMLKKRPIVSGETPGQTLSWLGRMRPPTHSLIGLTGSSPHSPLR
jgi:hypothetical protein